MLGDCVTVEQCLSCYLWLEWVERQLEQMQVTINWHDHNCYPILPTAEPTTAGVTHSTT